MKVLRSYDHFVQFVLAEDHIDDQNTHRPSGRAELLAELPAGCVKSRFHGRIARVAPA
jgi:hypothetical protein